MNTCNGLSTNACDIVDSESDRTVVSEPNINCTRVLFKSINAHVNTYILLVFYIVVYLYFISKLIFNNNTCHYYLVSDRILLSDSLSTGVYGAIPCKQYCTGVDIQP